MTTPTSRAERIAGLLILLGLGLWGTVLVARGRAMGWFRPEAHLSLLLDEAHGLADQAVVRMHGVPVGWVEEVRLLDDYRVEVEVHILPEHEGRLREGITALVKLPPMLGRSEVHLTPGGSGAPLVRGSRVPVTVSKDPVKTLLAVSEKASLLVEDLKGITGQVREGDGSLGRFLNDDGQIHGNIVDLTAEAKDLVGRVQDLTAKLGDGVDEMKGLLEGVSGKMEKVDVFLKDMTTISDKLDRIADMMTAREEGVPAILAGVEGTLAEVAAMLHRMRDELPATIDSARQATDEANRLIQAAQRSVFIRGNLEPRPAAQTTVGASRRHDPYEEP